MPCHDVTNLNFAARIEQVKSSCGLGNYFENTVPTLGHNGNVTPTSDSELGTYCYTRTQGLNHLYGLVPSA